MVETFNTNTYHTKKGYYLATLVALVRNAVNRELPWSDMVDPEAPDVLQQEGPDFSAHFVVVEQIDRSQNASVLVPDLFLWKQG